MTRFVRTGDALVADLSPPHWARRALGAVGFSLVLLALAIALLRHGQRYHWRCDDPAAVWLLFATVALCAMWAIHEERARQVLVLHGRELRYRRGWGPFTRQIVAELDDVHFDDHDGALIVSIGNQRLRLRAPVATTRARLLGACRAHQHLHTLRLR